MKVSDSPDDDVVAVILDNLRPIAVSGVGSSVVAVPESPHEDNNNTHKMYKLLFLFEFQFVLLLSYT